MVWPNALGERMSEDVAGPTSLSVERASVWRQGRSAMEERIV